MFEVFEVWASEESVDDLIQVVIFSDYDDSIESFEVEGGGAEPLLGVGGILRFKKINLNPTTPQDWSHILLYKIEKNQIIKSDWKEHLHKNVLSVCLTSVRPSVCVRCSGRTD